MNEQEPTKPGYQTFTFKIGKVERPPLPEGQSYSEDGEHTIIPIRQMNQQEWEEFQTEERFHQAMRALQRWLSVYEPDRQQGKFVYLEPVFEAIKLVQGEA